MGVEKKNTFREVFNFRNIISIVTLVVIAAGAHRAYIKNEVETDRNYELAVSAHKMIELIQKHVNRIDIEIARLYVKIDGK